MTKGEHQVAMDTVLPVQAVLPDQKVRKGNCKIVHHDFVKDVLFAE